MEVISILCIFAPKIGTVMAKYIIADNQEITRFAIESLLKQNDENQIYRASDKTSLVAKLKEHEHAVVILDYTLFDFADEDQLLIVSERFALSQWLLISDGDASIPASRHLFIASVQHSI